MKANQTRNLNPMINRKTAIGRAYEKFVEHQKFQRRNPVNPAMALAFSRAISVGQKKGR